MSLFSAPAFGWQETLTVIVVTERGEEVDMKGYIYRDYCAFLWRHRAEHRLPAVQSQLLCATIKVWISGPVKTNRLACCTATVLSQGYVHFFYRLQMSA